MNFIDPRVFSLFCIINLLTSRVVNRYFFLFFFFFGPPILHFSLLSVSCNRSFLYFLNTLEMSWEPQVGDLIYSAGDSQVYTESIGQYYRKGKKEWP